MCHGMRAQKANPPLLSPQRGVNLVKRGVNVSFALHGGTAVLLLDAHLFGFLALRRIKNGVE